MSESIKHDKSKLRYDLIPPQILESLAKIFTYGSIKYGENRWQKLDDGFNRYYAAMERHIQAYRAGEKKDKESKLGHLDHALWNLAVMNYFEGRNE